MNADTICKYAAAALLMASVLALVVLGKVDAATYVGLVTAALSGLGIHAAVRSAAPAIVNQASDGAAPATPPAPQPQQEVKS